MAFKQVQSQRLVQKLELKPRMLQSLQMLAMPLQQLELHIKQELINNPMLELTESADEENPPATEDINKIEADSTETAEKELIATMEEAKELSEALDEWRDFHAGQSSSREDTVDAEFFLKAKEDKKKEYADQIEYFELPANERDYSLDLIFTVDKYGFLPKDFCIETLALEYDIKAARARELHSLILSLIPKGITARNIEECLLAQLDEKYTHFDLITKIIRDDFQNLIHRRYSSLAGKYQVTISIITQCNSYIGHLDPRPGLRITSDDVSYIVPDVIIKEVDGEYIVLVNDFTQQSISINRRYLNMVKHMPKDKETMGFVRNKINSAKFLIKSMYMRNRTLVRVSKAIIAHQPGFFYDNTGVLEPLNYASIAADLGLNESTICRVVQKKYADTPFGVMCLKEFFSTTAGKDKNYESVSRQQVQVYIQQFIDDEDARHPLSDQELVVILKERGVSVSRRVVAKYRESMGILNSRLRKRRL